MQPGELNFVQESFPEGAIYNVFLGISDIPIGMLRKPNRTHKYLFYPANNTYYDNHLLKAIAGFCENLLRDEIEKGIPKEQPVPVPKESTNRTDAVDLIFEDNKAIFVPEISPKARYRVVHTTGANYVTLEFRNRWFDLWQSLGNYSTALKAQQAKDIIRDMLKPTNFRVIESGDFF